MEDGRWEMGDGEDEEPARVSWTWVPKGIMASRRSARPLDWERVPANKRRKGGFAGEDGRWEIGDRDAMI
jgi:hypothetical protein